MANIAIRAEGIGKRYVIGTERAKYNTIADSISGLRHRKERSTTEFWALQDISFEVPEGEVLGFIGHNGAGKSTLLKVLSRITDPTTGTIDIWGRVSSLLEVGSGFSFELTGRENVFLNGAILGMRRQEIERKYDEIVEFAEMAQFMETPVKRFSSGMFMRLAFSVAAHLEPEILMVDEVLAVGDAKFQQKCIGRMGDVAGQGRTVFFVSHDMAAMAKLAHRVIWLDGGKVRAEGEPSEIIGAYLRSQTEEGVGDGARFVRPPGDHPAYITSCEVRQQGSPTEYLMQGHPFEVVIRGMADHGFGRGRVAASFHDRLGMKLATVDTRDSHGLVEFEAGPFEAVVQVDSPNLMPGRYRMDLRFGDPATDFHLVHGAMEFAVVAQPIFENGGTPRDNSGTIYFPHKWAISQGGEGSGEGSGAGDPAGSGAAQEPQDPAGQ